MTEFDEVVLGLVMRKVRAYEQLQDRAYCGTLDMEGFYHLLLEAGYSEKDSQRAANERGWQRLQAGVKM